MKPFRVVNQAVVLHLSLTIVSDFSSLATNVLLSGPISLGAWLVAGLTFEAPFYAH